MKKFTFIICAKNDNYFENYIDRLEYVLNFNLNNIYECGLQNFIDIILVDYCSNKPLYKTINLAKKKFARNISFLNVDKSEIEKKFTSSNIRSFSPQVAVNLGAINIKSQFIMWGASDTILSIDTLFNIGNFFLNKRNNFDNKIFFCPRKNLDLSFLNQNYHSFRELNNFFSNFHYSKMKFNNQRIHTGGGFGSIIIKHSDFIKNNGLDESYDNLNWARNEVRFLHSINEKWQIKDLSSNGISMYKFNYSLSGDRVSQLKSKSFLSKFKNSKRIGIQNYKKIKIKIKKPIMFKNYNYFNISETFFKKKSNQSKNKNSFTKNFVSFLKFSYNFSLLQKYNYKNYVLLNLLLNLMKNYPILSFNLLSNNKKFINFSKVVSNYFKFININLFDLREVHNFENWDNLKSYFNSNHYAQVKYLSKKLDFSQSNIFFKNFSSQNYSNLVLINLSKNQPFLSQLKLNKLINKNFLRIFILIICKNSNFNIKNNHFINFEFSKNITLLFNKKLKIFSDKTHKSEIYKLKNTNLLLEYFFSVIVSFAIKPIVIFRKVFFNIKKKIKKKLK